MGNEGKGTEGGNRERFSTNFEIGETERDEGGTISKKKNKKEGGEGKIEKEERERGEERRFIFNSRV